MPSIMENSTIKSLVETAALNVKETETLSPMFFVSSKDTIGIMPGDFSDDESKDMTVEAVRLVVQKMDADFVFFLAESWLASAEDMANVEENRRRYGPSISKWPGSKEVVMFRYEAPNVVWGGVADIMPGRVMGEVKWTEMKPGEEKGRFTNFFSERRETN